MSDDRSTFWHLDHGPCNCLRTSNKRMVQGSGGELSRGGSKSDHILYLLLCVRTEKLTSWGIMCCCWPSDSSRSLWLATWQSATQMLKLRIASVHKCCKQSRLDIPFWKFVSSDRFMGWSSSISPDALLGVTTQSVLATLSAPKSPLGAAKVEWSGVRFHDDIINKVEQRKSQSSCLQSTRVR